MRDILLGLGLLTVSLVVSLTGSSPAKAQQSEAPKPKTYLIFFDYESTSMGQNAMAIIQQAASDYSNMGQGATIQILGYTDTAENSQPLSEQRATDVANALEIDGVPSSVVVVTGAGSSNPLVPTPPGTQQPLDRRVEILLY